jgi:hypothetical protein
MLHYNHTRFDIVRGRKAPELYINTRQWVADNFELNCHKIYIAFKWRVSILFLLHAHCAFDDVLDSLKIGTILKMFLFANRSTNHLP